jgi:hypothetical protein
VKDFRICQENAKPCVDELVIPYGSATHPSMAKQTSSCGNVCDTRLSNIASFSKAHQRNRTRFFAITQDWIHRDQQAGTKANPCYRFFLVIDDEVITHLFQLSVPADCKLSISAVYSIKVYDARVNSPREFSGGESESDTDEEYEDSAYEGFEGWF